MKVLLYEWASSPNQVIQLNYIYLFLNAQIVNFTFNKKKEITNKLIILKTKLTIFSIVYLNLNYV